MICMEMPGNGVRTGMIDTVQVILSTLKGLIPERPGFFGVEAGASAPARAAQPFATNMIQH